MRICPFPELEKPKSRCDPSSLSKQPKFNTRTARTSRGCYALTLGPSTNTSWTAQATTTSSLDLFYNYPSNVTLYDKWHEYFRKHQPRMLILWGQNDPFFTVAG